MVLLGRYKLVLFVTACCLVVSCASNKTTVTKTTKQSQIEVTDSQIPESNDLLSVAQQNWLANGDIQQRNATLLQAAQGYQNQQNCIKSDIIIAAISETITSSINLAMAQLLKAECGLLSLENRPMPLSTLQNWADEIETVNPEIANRKQILQAYLHSVEQNYALAIKTLIPVVQHLNTINEKPALTLWEWYTQLSKQERARLSSQHTFLDAYAQLGSLIDDIELTDIGRRQAIENWREQHSDHPLNQDFPDNILAFIQQDMRAITNITVLLPLSGRLEAQGDAIKQGITAAYLKRFEQTSRLNPSDVPPIISFVDTGSNLTVLSDMATNPAIYQDSDLLIGPLLKAHVEQVQSLNVNRLPAIFLNRADEVNSILQNSVFFSLSPEDEGSQIAQIMIDNNITTPVIVSNDSATSKRMLDAFLQTWTEYGALKNAGKQTPSIINFTNNKSMRIGITSALDVLQSQRRIRQMSNVATETVHSVTRNRRDVDAFVVFARPDEVELINPIIEASISLFSEVSLPVYASSYSYQHQLNKNSIRDLRNIVFIDMPWLMPNQRQSELAKEVDTIWNNPQSSFLRLFAFGFDSYQFAQNYQQLSFFKQNRLTGLTGTLQVNAQQQVVRRLPVATISEDEITISNGL